MSRSEQVGNLIPIDDQPGTRFPVNARDLHAYMGIGRLFATWMSDRIKKFQLVENVDYLAFSNLEKQKTRGGDRCSKIYNLTLTAARWLAADVNSDKGRKLIKFWVAAMERVCRSFIRSFSSLKISTMEFLPNLAKTPRGGRPSPEYHHRAGRKPDPHQRPTRLPLPGECPRPPCLHGDWTRLFDLDERPRQKVPTH